MVYKNKQTILILCLAATLSLSACNVSIRNPSNIEDILLLTELPSNVLNKPILLEYTDTVQNDPAFEMGEQVSFLFDDEGALFFVEEGADDILIAESYELENQRFIWVDDGYEGTGLTYVLRINDDYKIANLTILDADGDPVGFFGLPAKNTIVDTVSDANENQEQNETTGTALPSSATGPHLMRFVEDISIGVSAPFDAGEEIEFSFFSSGPLMLRGIQVDDSYEERDLEFVWTAVINNNEYEYRLILDASDEVQEIGVFQAYSGLQVGWFVLIGKVTYVNPD